MMRADLILATFVLLCLAVPPPPAFPDPTDAKTVAADPPKPAARVGGHIREPRKVVSVSPQYPALARQGRVQGIVVIECTISTEGRVVEARVIRSIPLLDQAAVDAVKQWVYTPTLLEGKPVPVIMTVTVN